MDDGNGNLDYYTADVQTATDYFPFGMQMPRRNDSAGSGYRFGFQGQEKDDEIYGDGNALSFKYRIHDPRLGRFLSRDPLMKKYPWNSPYAFQENKLGLGIELEGLELAPMDEDHQQTYPVIDVPNHSYLSEFAGYEIHDLQFVKLPDVNRKLAKISIALPDGTEVGIFYSGNFLLRGIGSGDIHPDIIYSVLSQDWSDHGPFYIPNYTHGKGSSDRDDKANTAYINTLLEFITMGTTGTFGNKTFAQAE
ncbi:MAG: hypothetical protein GY751_14645, partial [Bacteroidetes bacterium]|nr:hypothetical protein [Bacteroidota bacterium]